MTRDFKDLNGRSGRIRTDDPLTPSQVRYRAALHSGPRKAIYFQWLWRNPRFRVEGDKLEF